MALFRMLWIVVSSLWVSAEDARSCPKGYYCPEQTRQPVLCPARHYCPEGSAEPSLCPSGRVCKGQDLEALVNGQIWAAGENDYGELGTGSTVEQHAFVQVAFDGKKIVALAAGEQHTAAITDSGELWTWGYNDDGELGIGDTTDRHAPVKVSVNGQKIVAVAAGDDHTAAITDSGELWTWGYNSNGQLGIGGTTNRHAPVKVSVNGQKIVAVAAGSFHSAAITDSGELWTWGWNGNGQLGVGDTTDRHAPVKVSVNGQKIVAVAAGSFHTAAITDSGELWTWGNNDAGKLGAGDSRDRHLPAKAAAVPARVSETHIPLCWSPRRRASSLLGEAFLAVTWGSKIPVPRECGVMRSQLAAFLQKCQVHVGAWEATPCPAGSFCPKKQVLLAAKATRVLLLTRCAAGEAGSAGDTRGSQSDGSSTEAERARGGGDTAWDFRGTEALGIWPVLMIVSALSAISFSVFVGLFWCSSPVTQYDHRGRRVLKIRSPNSISIHDVSVHHFGLRVEVYFGHRAAKPRLVQTRLRSSLEAFEFRQSETVMEDGFLYLHFAEAVERKYEFPFPEEDSRMVEGNRTPSESTQNSYEYVALGEEEVNGTVPAPPSLNGGGVVGASSFEVPEVARYGSDDVAHDGGPNKGVKNGRSLCSSDFEARIVCRENEAKRLCMVAQGNMGHNDKAPLGSVSSDTYQLPNTTNLHVHGQELSE
ncbi:UVR8 [Symbiodinium microadriaticum]|nr:UVR8 [Symbiodinium microadriaticum]